MHLVALTAVASAVLLSSVLVSLTLHDAQPTPYMDEIFHVPQAQNYCAYNVSHWDPMITTPPGLYLTSLMFLLPLRLVTNTEVCSLFALRCCNIVLTLGNFYVSSLIAIKLAGAAGSKVRAKLVLSSAAMSLLPVLHFFTFLYYTDPGSVLFLQLMYLYSLFDRHHLAACFGAVAVLYRQTSVVWVFMVAACKALEIAESVFSASDNKPEGLSCAVAAIASAPMKQARLFADFAKRVLSECAGYVVVGLSFVAFVLVNDGIVLGDKSSHQACAHLPQLGYFALFTLVHAAPYLLQPGILRRFCESVLRRPFFYAAVTLACLLAVQNFTYVHPYLLADNRHFPFYLWRRLLGRNELVRCCLVPFYIYAGYAMSHQLRHKKLLWQLLFFVCVVATTVPQKLLEFRYFIVPYLFFRLQLKDVKYWQVLTELVANISLNVAAMWLFLNRTFTWTGDPAVQRFMW
ncbi:putative Dol-P-Glc:Glc(2)Man(9)GlcNAc(2)-PP-Dol alpha-1,2-glucosyltransferase [Rhipicephalus sanguineus]|nr:putative Dol-P-Glc:Glc(2)Man(9)GlcNAc(2)-PP-Dol alpha-1,2-glucosyltransferase [Rhipicephalus sanguineus]